MKDIAYVKQRIKKIYYYLSETVKINLSPNQRVIKLKNGFKDSPEIIDRLNYYCKDLAEFKVSKDGTSIGEFKKN